MKCKHCPVKTGGCVGVCPGANGYAIPRYCDLAAKDNRYDDVIIKASEGIVEPVEVQRPTTFLRDRELVVARYREDVSWVTGVPMRATVYNKGEPLEDLGAGIKVFELENTKRETGSYLQYIIDRYHSLPDIVLFCQGNPFDHTDNFIERLSLPYYQPTTLTTRYLADCPVKWIKDHDRVTMHYGYECRYGHARLSEHGDFASTGQAWFNPSAWKYIFTWALPEEFYFAYGAMIACPKFNILARPLGFWKWLLAECDSGASGKSWTDPPLNPWSFEALFMSILDPWIPVKWQPVPDIVSPDVVVTTPARRCGACGHKGRQI